VLTLTITRRDGRRRVTILSMTRALNYTRTLGAIGMPKWMARPIPDDIEQATEQYFEALIDEEEYDNQLSTPRACRLHVSTV
jgi:hypothetical protein